MKLVKFLPGLLLLTFVLAPKIYADSLLFNTGVSGNAEPRDGVEDDGVGQGVSVSTTTTLSSFSFYGNLPNGGDVKFLIFDGTDSTLLFSQTQTFAASDTQTWLNSGALSFTLNAGSDYYFGFYADQLEFTNYFIPTLSMSSNGIANLQGNSNYTNYDDPAFDGDGGVTFDLQLNGTQVAATPEPGSFALLGTGVLGVAGMVRRRLRMA